MAVSQENLYSVEKSTMPDSSQNESQGLEMQGHTIEAVIPDPYHLPECHYTVDTGNIQYGWNECICDALRACEQRIRQESQSPYLCLKCWHQQEGHACERPQNCTCRDCNYAAALDAAEAAVETWISYTFPAHRPGWTGKIIAAIRALKEKP